MERTWTPSHWGATLTGSEPWKVTLAQTALRVQHGTKSTNIPLLESDIVVKLGLFWASVVIKHGTAVIADLDGIPNLQGLELRDTCTRAADIIRQRKTDLDRITQFKKSLPSIVAWSRKTANEMVSIEQNKRWQTEEHINAWLDERPGKDISLAYPAIVKFLIRRPDEEQQAVSFWNAEIRDYASQQNEKLVQGELRDCKSFFDQVEKSPLTEEQARAVLCFDNRVLVVASAGSGKTSTMVAKAGYALHRKLFEPDEILVLAFNADAAKELQARIQARLVPLDLPAEKIQARTFHAFGLDIIGQSTGKKPSLAPWLEGGGDIRRLVELVDELKDSDQSFRTAWDLFRIVLGRDLPAFGEEEESPEDWDTERGTTGFRTLDGKVVKSQGERLIGDWLFYNGVEYLYEPRYKIDTADASHRQYTPDFYYPQIDTYHEHWAVDENGNPPESFTGYAEGMRWKQALHIEQETELIETTMAGIWSGRAFDHLADELARRGIELDPDPDREPATGRHLVKNEELARTFRTFLTHAKSNRLSNEGLQRRLKERAAGTFHYRHELFLKLFAKIRKAWEDDLQEHGYIDFEDMLNLASDELESGRYDSGYKLVMVDEFQDASQARARLSRALVNKPGRCLFAVGDDWQSINRFAGADLSVMTQFQEWFGRGKLLRLERTFRCPQPLCDIASDFVQANPAQIRKNVVSDAPEIGQPLQVIEVEDDQKLSSALLMRMESISRAVSAGEIPIGKNGKISIYVLGRYRRDREHMPRWQHLAQNLEVEFTTVHGSKGLEADYVFLARMVSGFFSFPSTIIDDPVLQLAMPLGDEYTHAEERRLFYVGLTRAHRGVIIFTVKHKHSPFLVELRKSHDLEPENVEGKQAASIPCPAPGCNGSMVPKHGRYGRFLGCSNFPRCRETSNLRT